MNSLANFIIRPKRAEYDPNKDLGPQQFFLNGKQRQRIDFEIINNFSLKLKCSLFAPAVLKGKYPCIIYCHGNSACRTEALEAVDLLVSQDIIVAALDFSGSGLSEGKYVTLGFNEHDDLRCLVNHLRTLHYISDIGLWGRSMGAATCIMYAATDPNIAVMCLDSGFLSLLQLCTDTLKSKTLGTFLGSMFLGSVRKVIQKKANFDLEDVSPISCIPNCKMPALFLHGTKDKITPISHSRMLFSEYPGSSKIHEVNVDHNDPRPNWVKQEIKNFFIHKFAEIKKKQEFNEQMASVLNSKLNKVSMSQHKIEEIIHHLTYHDNESPTSRRATHAETLNSEHDDDDQPRHSKTKSIHRLPAHKLSLDSTEAQTTPRSLHKLINTGALKIYPGRNAFEEDSSGAATNIHSKDINPVWNLYGKGMPLMSLRVNQGHQAKIDDDFGQVPRGYHSKVASLDYNSEGDM